MEILVKFEAKLAIHLTDFKDIKYQMEVLLFYTDDIIENLTSLLNLHVSLLSQKINEGSYRTNELMRVLTIFSIFFLPLNFIAGIYGMNFDNIPELRHPYGYYAALLIMFLLSLGIFVWIYKKGWMRGPEE